MTAQPPSDTGLESGVADDGPRYEWLTPDRQATVRTILLGIAEAAPYLFDLLRADGARALRLLGCEPDRHLAELLDRTCRQVWEASTEAEVMQLLRGLANDGRTVVFVVRDGKAVAVPVVLGIKIGDVTAITGR